MNCSYKPYSMTNIYLIGLLVIIFAYLQLVSTLDLSQTVDTQTVRPGGKFQVTNQTLIEDLSNFIISNSSLSPICSVHRVVNPQQQIVAGTLYYMTVQISRIRPGSGYTSDQCGTIDPANLDVLCQDIKLFKPLNSDSYKMMNETQVDCPF